MNTRKASLSRHSHVIELLETRIAPAFAAVVDLSTLGGVNGFEIHGETAEGGAGFVVSVAGDVNGDGFDDLIIGAPGLNPIGTTPGASYVVFGKAGGFGSSLDLSTLDGSNGFRIYGEAVLDSFGGSVSSAGDMNGDGFDDLIIGAADADPNGSGSGASYVIFGKAGGFTATLDLASLNGGNGFRIYGEVAAGAFGFSVSSAGDVNGDGFADVIIGAPKANLDDSYTGASYVIFGKAGGFAATLELASLDGANGFKIPGIDPGGSFGSSVSAAGDVNGDGFGDLIIGAPTAGPIFLGGASYVLFGKASGFATTLDLHSLNGSNGFKITVPTSSRFGESVRAAGDVNGDGFDDLIVGAPGNYLNETPSGNSYVIFGREGGFGSTFDVANLDGVNGFKIPGQSEDGSFGVSVSTAGDVNGDGLDDLIIGAYASAPNGTASGAAYVVFGKAGGFTATLNLTSLDGHNGFKIPGLAAGDLLGRGVGAAGDVNGDGFDDMIIGAPGAGLNGSSSGTSYVIFGQPHVQVKFSAGGKVATFLDFDGDQIQVKVSKGSLNLNNFTFSEGILQKINLSIDAEEFAGTNLTVTAKKGGWGDGRINVGAIDARGLNLGVVKLPGDLGQIDAGAGNIKIPAIKSLSVGSLGLANNTQPADTPFPFQSDIVGALGTLTVQSHVKGVINVTGGLGANIGKVTIGGALDGSAGGTLAGLLRAGGNIGSVIIKNNVSGGAEFSGIIAGGKLGKVTIAGDLRSDSDYPVTISALGDLTATTATKAVAIAGVKVGGGVMNARILAGYNASLGAVNPDASIGAVTVHDHWTRASLVAGVADTTGDGFGRNDERIAGGMDKLVATIAKITIGGTATGTPADGDHFGITAERVGKLKIGRSSPPLDRTANDLLLDEANGDFRVVDFA